MSDADTRATCANCGLPILDGEAVDWTPIPPKRLCHATHADCFARLRADLAAALAVVRAARIVRVRYRREERAEKLYTRAYYAPGVFPAELAEERRRAYDESCDAREVLVAATTAYVRGGAR